MFVKPFEEGHLMTKREESMSLREGLKAKPCLSKVNMYSLLSAIKNLQVSGQREPALRQLKGQIEAFYPEHIVTWVSITQTRTIAISSGLVIQNGYSHSLTEAGEAELARLETETSPPRQAAVA